jgi:alpha-L-fucosidase
MAIDAETTRVERMAWWHEAKFGMFVHWGCYSVLGRGEQAIVRDLMPLDEYLPIANDFKPASDWAGKLADHAVRSGAKYVVITTRHHDGYCMWDTATHDFNAVQTGPGRDLIAEYVQALRDRNLKVGFYYSVINWRWHGFWDPHGYPEELPKIVDEIHAQVRELLTNYGSVDILWYDVPQVPGGRTPGSFGYEQSRVEESPDEFYRSAQLNAMARELQPHILINNRSGLPEDFGTPEQHVTPEAGGRAWESCMTVNFAPNWANVHHSVADKSTGQLLFHLVQAVRIGGNFLLNVGPDERGHVVERDGAKLEAIGSWLARNGEAIYGTTVGRIYEEPNQGPCYHYGMFTTKGTTAYLTLFYYPRDYVVISRIGGGLRSATILGSGESLEVAPMSNRRWRVGGLPLESPDPLATVLKLEFDEEPYLLHYAGATWLDGELTVFGEQ